MGPYDDILGLNPDPLNPLRRIALAAARRPDPALPDVPPAQQDAMLGDLMERSLGGLAYLGKLADKTFGGRAVRGLLGGRPRELLSVLPLSDTLGLTDEKDTVNGTDLLENAGLITKGDDSWQNLAAGFGAELLLDPATYLGFGPLTKAGQVAEKAGALPKGLAAKVRGFDVAEPAIAANLQPGQRLIDAEPKGQNLLTNELANRAASEGVALGPGTPLANLLGVGLPFTEPLATFGSGQTARKIAGALDAAGSAVAGAAPVRAVRAALDPIVGSAYNRGAQVLSSDTLRPTRRAMERAAALKYLDFVQQAEPLIQKNPELTGEVVRMAAEHDPAGAMPWHGKSLGQQAIERALAGGFSPDEAAQAAGIGRDLGEAVREFDRMESDLGMNTSKLTDAFANYLTRQKNPLPRQPGEGIWSYFRRQAQEFSTTHGSQVARDEMFKDIPGGTVQINDWAKDPALKQMPDLQRQEYLRRELTGTPVPPPESPAWKKAQQLSRWIESLPLAHSQAGIDFFKADPFADFLLRGKRSARGRSGAETVFEGVKQFAAPKADLLARGEAGVPVDELLRQLALDGAGAGGGLRGPEIAAQRLGVGNLNDLKDYALPEEVARDMLRLGRAWDNPQELSPLLRAWDAASKMFTSWVTVPFAAFHARNLLSGLFNMWRDGALDPAALADAFRVLRGGLPETPLPALGRTPQDVRDALIRNAAADRVAFTRDSGRAADTTLAPNAGLIARAPNPGANSGSLLGDLLGGVRGLIPERGKVLEGLNPFNVEGVNRAADTNTLIRTMRDVQGKLDDWVQLSHYVAKLKQGFDPAAAGLAVKKYHLDYSDLTPLERNVLKRVFPWYSFSRRSLPPVVEDLATNPAKMAAAFRLVSGVRDPFEFVPPYIAEGASIPIPGAPDGQKRYVSSFGLPIEDELLKTLGSVARGDVTRALQQLIGMAQPVVKAPLEQAFGTQLYSGRPLESLRPLGMLDNPNVFNEEQARVASQLVANTPFSRFFTTLDKLTDDRKGLGPTLLNTLTGMRVQDVDAAKERDLAAKKLLQDALRGRPGVRVDQSIYIPRDKLPGLDPQELELYLLYQAAQKRAKEAAAIRSQAAAQGVAPSR